MNRGFNNNFGGQGGRPNNFGGQGNQPAVDYRERANQSDRRYDNFYGGGGGGANNNRNVGGGGGNWNGPQQQQPGFNQQQAPAGRGVGVGAINVNGQVLSAIQQQNLINALVSNNQQQNIARIQQQQQNNQLQGNQFRRPVGGPGNRGGFAGFNARAGDKRNMAQSGNFNNRQAGKNAPSKFQPKKAKEITKDSPKPKATTKPVAAPPKPPAAVIVVEDEIEIPDDEVEVPDSLKEAVEKLRTRSGEIERNAVDEDVEKLSTFSYTGKGYHCITCDILLLKEVSFINHLNHKSHVMKVIDARTSKNYKETRAILDIDLSSDSWLDDSELAHSIIFKQAKVDMRQKKAQELKEKAEYNKTPSNFYKFNMEMRKCVVKQDDEVVITSLVESTVGVKDFTGGKFFGCEFVRAVTGFHCRLCSINIREAKGVLPHIETKLHKNNYAKYLANNPDYENMQNVQNQDLHDIMLQHEGKSVVLAESSAAESSRFLSLLDNEVVRIPSVMDPEIKKKEAEEKAKAEAAEAKAKADAEAEKAKLEAEAAAEEKGDDAADADDDGAEGNDADDDGAEGNDANDEGMDEEETDETTDKGEEHAEEAELVDEETTEDNEPPEEPAEEVKDVSEETEDLSFAEDTTTDESAKDSPKVNKAKVKKVATKVKGK